MAIATQYNPNPDLNRVLLDAGASKTVYALVTPETEITKGLLFNDRAAYLDMFREAWTGKQDAYHEEFFSTWHAWSSPVVDLDREQYPFFYPTAGASEALRHLIYSLVRIRGAQVHIFEGEYEGYRAMAEAAGLEVIEHSRDRASINRIEDQMEDGDLFFISQPSAIDGNIWHYFNEFVAKMPPRSVVADITYVGAVPHVEKRFNLNAQSINNVVFSLSKPFGVYYDRIGGVFCRDEDLGLFGNKWFKNLTSLRLGTLLMSQYGVFELPRRYADLQSEMCDRLSNHLGFGFTSSDVYLLATAKFDDDDPMANYLRRAGLLRICLTPGMAAMLGDTK